MSAFCPECHYLREERAGIHEYDGKLPRAEAERLAQSERCERHRDRSMAETTQEWAQRQRARARDGQL